MDRFTPQPSEMLSANSSTAAAGAAASLHVYAAAPQDTGGLVAYILERYHKVHRQELPGLIALAREVAGAMAGDRRVPRDFAEFLEEMAGSLEVHMLMEEHILFPMLAGEGRHLARQTIRWMRGEHDAHDYQLEALEEFIRELCPPEDASPGWRALYAGVTKFACDLAGHIRIENEVLFPKFDA